MEKITLKAEERKLFGKNACKKLRKEGLVPGVVYHAGEIGPNIQVDFTDLWHVLHTEAGDNAIITIEISGDGSGQTKTAILQEIQTDPINNNFVHVDFREISLKEKLHVNVPVATKGEAVGVQEEDGVLNQVMWELEVECLPTEIPEHINVQVDELKIGDAIHVKDLVPPEHVEFLDDPDQVVVMVNPPEEFVEEEEEEVLGEEMEEPELIKKGKKEEEEVPEEAEAAGPAPEEGE